MKKYAAFLALLLASAAFADTAQRIGLDAFSTTTASFTQPDSGATVVVHVKQTQFAPVGAVEYVTGGGYYQVVASALGQLTLKNLGYAGNAGAGTTIGGGMLVSPGGLKGTDGGGTANLNAISPLAFDSGSATISLDTTGFANSILSNISNTSIAAPLVPSTDLSLGALDIGTSLKRWAYIHAYSIVGSQGSGLVVDGGDGSLILTGTNVSMGAQRLQTLGEPVNSDDAATKNYVDTHVPTITSGDLTTSTSGLTITGGTGAVLGTGATVDIQTATTARPGLLTAADWNTFNDKQAALTIGSLTDTGTDGILVTGGTSSVLGAGVTLSQHVADSTHSGYLSVADWGAFNAKQGALTFGNLTSSTTGVSITGGTGAVIGSGASLSIQTASGTQPGLLSSADWSTFNGKQAALTIGSLTDTGTDGISVTGGANSVIGSGASLSQHVADATHNGYLSSADWGTFNGKQGAGNYITALTGDVSASGPGSVSSTVSLVGGSSAANVHAAELLANAATSANTASAIVRRDGSGNISVADPTSAAHAATKGYVDNLVNGLNWKPAAKYATATALPANTYANGTSGVGATLTANANGALSIDGGSPSQGQRILVKNESTTANNGVYTVTQAGDSTHPFILTRALDFNSASTITGGDALYVTAGGQASTSWSLTDPGSITVGTTALAFGQASGPGSYTAGAGLTLTGTAFSLTSPIAASALPTPGASTLGGVKSSTAPTHQFFTLLDTSGALGSAQPAFSDISGSVSTGQLPTITNSLLATMGANMIKGNNTGSTAAPADLTVSQVNTMLGTLTAANNLSDVGTRQTALNNLAGAVTSGTYARGNGTNVSMSAIQAADVPTLNQNTTGTAATITGVATPSHGGTGLATLTAHGLVAGEGTSNVAAVGPGTSAQILIAQGAAADPSFNSMSGDGSISSTGALTVTKTSGSNFAASATTDTTSATNITSGTLSLARLAAPLTSATVSGNTSTLVTTTGTLTSGDCVKIDVSGNMIDAGAACGSGGGGTTTVPNGGTGLTTLTNHGIVLGQGTSNVAFAGPGTSAQLLIAQGASADPSFNSMSGDATLSSTGAITVTKTSGSNFAASATTDTTNAANITTGVLGIARGGTNVGSVTTSPAATSFAGWDANKNLSSVGFLPALTSTATAASTTTLTVGSNQTQVFTGTNPQIVALPVASTLANGQFFDIINASTGSVTVQTSGANSMQVMTGSTRLRATVVNSGGGTGLASWRWSYQPDDNAGTPVSFGGTGQTSLTSHGILIGAGTGGITASAAPALGTILTGQGSSADPSFQTVSGDCTALSGAFTCTKTNGSSFATVATSGSASDLSAGTLAAARLPTSVSGAKTANYSILSTDYLIKADNSSGSFTLTMPSPVSSTHEFVLYNVGTGVGTNTITIAANASETFGVNAYASIHMTTQGETWRLQSDGTNWIIQYHYAKTKPASFTPVVSATTTAPTMATGATNLGWWERDGRDLILREEYVGTTITGAASGTGDYLWTLPLGLAMDSTYITISSPGLGQGAVGSAQNWASADTQRVCAMQVHDSTHLKMQGNTGGSGFVSSTYHNFNGAGGVRYGLEARVPISGWEE